MPQFFAHVIPLGLCACAPLVAQRIWVVDASNGPGTDFLDLPPAVAAAADGDLIAVRAGSYSPPIVSKGLTIVGGPDARLVRGLRVENLLPHQEVVIARLTVPATTLNSFTVQNNQGRVLFDRVVAAVDSFEIRASRQVHCNDCVLEPGVTAGVGNVVSGSTVTFARTRLVGSSGGGFLFPPSRPGLTVDGAAVVLSQCSVEGGLGSFTFQRSPQPGISATNSTISVRGDTAARVVVGGDATEPVAAIVAQGGTLSIDPHVQLLPLGGAPPITGTAAVVTARLPSLVARGVAPGGTLQAELFSAAGELVAFVTSLTADVTPAGAMGMLWIDPFAFFVLDVRVQGASEHLMFSLPIPNNGSLVFRPWTLQALSGSLAGGFKLSGPATFSLN